MRVCPELFLLLKKNTPFPTKTNMKMALFFITFLTIFGHFWSFSTKTNMKTGSFWPPNSCFLTRFLFVFKWKNTVFLTELVNFLLRGWFLMVFGGQASKGPSKWSFRAENDKNGHFAPRAREGRFRGVQKRPPMRQLDRKIVKKWSKNGQFWAKICKICRGGAGKVKKWPFWMRQLDRPKMPKTSESL